MLRTLARENPVGAALAVFIVAYACVVMAQPAALFASDGTLRDFGVGTKNRTVVPAWLVAIMLAVLAYLCVLWFIAAPTLTL